MFESYREELWLAAEFRPSVSASAVFVFQPSV
jgi:hypothetical protein